jgi:hypothetical protein
MKPVHVSGGRLWRRAIAIVARDAKEWNVARRRAAAGIVLPLLVAVATGALAGFAPFRPLYRALVWEDGVVEWIQVVLVSGLVVLGIVIRTRLAHAGYPWFGRLYLAAAVGAMFVLGEEISWGQRIFGWTTPDALAEVNEQAETNLHNVRGVLSVLNLVVLGVAAAAAALPIVWRTWAGRRARSFAEALLVPPLFVVPAFLPVILYRMGRMMWLPDAPATVSRYQEVTEMCFYFGFFTFAWLVASRLRQEALEDQTGPWETEAFAPDTSASTPVAVAAPRRAPPTSLRLVTPPAPPQPPGAAAGHTPLSPGTTRRTASPAFDSPHQRAAVARRSGALRLGPRPTRTSSPPE